ncbi:hypothetical protein [Mesomycoplasma hyopneumoniae]|uniref:Uncharacterized protein n=2 Tax=Mesomycoplasma hyopneumoniae TaxID=2099 RepID=Q600C8_MESH2|nr:hypothetical protein [Mesomycoplasma hyopneumoniae]AAV27608.1 hypothetical protein mhp528 [Mesomycoplasma hyopneumoniae 232]ASU14216.1 hypothetical protein CIB43_00305 [Mesomycoplasma hyopneumoniae]NYN91731.1 hypothetical protein [Mesomycoplasma hyopneumoniae]OWG16215.1 hypothetical protein B5C39_01290 [Mesomycoplasma hyopneumoniae]UIF67246.1 hypothetical protein KUD10_01180 [Mesomycoplasma hyopneumoniae]
MIKQKEKLIETLQENLKILQNSDLEKLEELKNTLLSELKQEILTRKQQIQLVENLIKNKKIEV